MNFLQEWANAAHTSVGFFWMALWAFALGYLISSLIQVMVSRGHMKSLRSLDEDGVTCILLSVAPSNAAAISVYEKLGFDVVRKAENYLGLGEHRLIMQRKITDKD